MIVGHIKKASDSPYRGKGCLYGCEVRIKKPNSRDRDEVCEGNKEKLRHLTKLRYQEMAKTESFEQGRPKTMSLWNRIW